MSFREYAFRELVTQIEEDSDEPLLLPVLASRESFDAIPQIYTLIREPSYLGESDHLISPKRSAELFPVVQDFLHESDPGAGGIKIGATLKEQVMLPALFCALGHAVCARGKQAQIIVMDAADRPVAIVDFDRDQWSPYAEHIQEGSRAFWTSLFDHVPHSPVLQAYLLINPPSLEL